MNKPTLKRRNVDEGFMQPENGAVLDDPRFPQVDETPDAGGEDDKITKLLDRIKNLEDTTERQRRTNLALMAQTPVTAPPVQDRGAEPVLDYSGLDQIADPVQYHAEMARRNQEYQRQVREYEASAVRGDPNTVNMAQRTAALWEDFVEQYPEYADKQEAIQFVATKVVSKKQARGIDPQRYVFGASEDFFEEVDREYRKQFGSPRKRSRKDADVGDEDDSPATGADDPAAAEALFGGTPSAPRGGKRKVDPDAPSGGVEGSFLAEIFETQRKAGYMH